MNKTYQLPEENGHIVSYSEYGNPKGTPILSFHGGPGSKSKPKHAKIFDLEKYRVILFDQRGCGESTPSGNLTDNTTNEILSDAERIREKLGINTWYVSGGSWGSTLALLYAGRYKERVKGLLISAIWLGNRASTDWSFQGIDGVAQLMPDTFEKREAFLKKYKTTPKKAAKTFSELLETIKLEEQKEIAAGVMNWESNLFSPASEISYIDPEDVEEKDITEVKIFLHYEKNDWFIEDNQIMDNIDIIKNVPTVIVHGRYDILCPMTHAYKLKTNMNDLEFVIASASGHAFSVEGNEIRRLAFDRFLNKNDHD